MKTISTAAVLMGILFVTAASAYATDWDDVRGVFGKKGEEDQGVLLIKFYRDDLHVKMGDIEVAPHLVLDTWYGFWLMPDGTVMLMGDTVVTESELPTVLTEIQSQGLEISAIHNHLAGESPRVYFTHISGHGTAAELARKAKAVLSRTHAPQGKEEEKEKSAAVNAVNWTPITKVLGKPAEMENDIIEYGFKRREQLAMMGHPMPSTDALETAPEVKFQMLPDGRAVTYGEMILTAREVNPVFRAITQGGILVTALHNHMLDEQPRLFFMHWWGVGDPAKLASTVKSAADAMNVEKEKTSDGAARRLAR